MALTTPQRTISITIIGNDGDSRVRYSYWSPNTGETFTNTPNCDLYFQLATDCLFVLDYDTTQNGWTIVDTTPNPPDSPSLEQVPGAKNLSILTVFPDTEEAIYRFYINYKNTLTGVEISVDPQEGNIP